MNIIDRQITVEGRRNVVVKWTGILDTSDVDENPALSLADCLNNEPRLILTGFRVDLIEWSIASPMEVQLYWQSASPQQIFPLAGRGRINSWNYGGFIPDTTRSGYNGNIRLTTTGHVPGQTQNFTVVCEFIKMYSQ